MPERPAGVLFDMDGLLLDSERLARDAFLAACAEAGQIVTLEVYHRCIGTTAEATRQLLLDAYGENFPFAAVEARWSAHYHARLADGPVPVKAGARALLTTLRERAVPLALVTSTRRPLAEGKLEATELLEFFHCLICGGDTERGKPAPDPYLAAASSLGLDPARCWALEDSGNGVRAALGAGCTVFQIPDLVTPGPELQDLGHRILDSLTEVRAIYLALD
ncbi:MAG: HAD family phosphatase [Pseudomonadota bacterium]